MTLVGVGTACNNCCIMCVQIMPPPRGGWDRTTKQLEDVIMGFRTHSEIALVGGEPTVRPDFIHILRFIRKTIPRAEIRVLTNGRMFYYPEFTKKVIDAGCNEIIIPLHGPNAEVHDSISRAPGSFEQTVQGIKNLLGYGDKVRIEIRVVIHKMNYKHLPALSEFISKEFKGVWRVVLFPMDIVGNANLNRTRLLVKITDVKPYLERAVGILEKNGFECKLYHTPFCVIDKNCWKSIPGKTVEERRLSFEPCDGCVMKEKCSGIWKTYAFRAGTKEFKPIKS
jgi:His-Xaa-Ser system radical SAM maturase HxsC